MPIKEQFTSKWTVIQSKVQQKWNKLTQEELKSTQGDFEKVSSLIQKKYGQPKEQVNKDLEQILHLNTQQQSGSNREPVGAAAGHQGQSHQAQGSHAQDNQRQGSHAHDNQTQSHQGHQGTNSPNRNPSADAHKNDSHKGNR